MNTDIVSIIITTYNSAKTIEETLTSMSNQTYPFIEIVVTDDHSTDNTLEVVETWGKNHPAVSLVIVNSPVNTGVSPNINRGVKASHGKWLKLIAGDDLLVEDAIERYLQFCDTHKVEVCVSKLAFFGDQSLIDAKSPAYDIFFNYYASKTLKERQKIILRENTIPMPGLFISRKLFDEVGGIDEAYPFGEEWPLYVKILEYNHDLPMFSDRLVEYRCVHNTLSAKKGNLLDRRVFNDQKAFYKKERRSKMLRNRMYGDVFLQDIHYWISGFKYKSDNKITLTILKYINPVSYMNRIKFMLRK